MQSFDVNLLLAWTSCWARNVVVDDLRRSVTLAGFILGNI